MKNVAIFFVLCSILLTGCYFNSPVESYELGVKTSSGRVSEVVSAGRYSGGLFKRLHIYDTRVQVGNWTDPDLVTYDIQPIGISLTVNYRRISNSTCAQNMYNNYNTEFKNNEQLWLLVEARLAEAAKASTVSLTLTDMLGTIDTQTLDESGNIEILSGDETRGRGVLREKIIAQTKENLEGTCIELVDLFVTNVAPSQGYLNIQEAITIEREELRLENQKRQTAQAALQTERAETQVQIEIANRENEVSKIKSEVLEESPATLELEKMKIWAAAIESGNVVFLPSDTNLIFGNTNSAVLPEN